MTRPVFRNVIVNRSGGTLPPQSPNYGFISFNFGGQDSTIIQKPTEQGNKVYAVGLNRQF